MDGLKDFKFIAILVSVLILLSMVGAFIINNNKETYYCDNLNSTEKTCYPNYYNWKEKKLCRDGWTPVAESIS